MNLSDYPALFSASDNAAKIAKQRFSRALAAHLGLLGCVSGFGILSPLTTGRVRVVMAALAAIFLGVAILLMWWMRAQKPERTWFDCRAVAESVKTAVWRYMMQIPPFGASLDQAAANRKFIEILASIRHERPGVEKNLVGRGSAASEITDAMRNARALGPAERKELYMRERLQDQMNWYEDKAAANRKRADKWLRIVLGIQTIALVMAILRILAVDIPLNPVSILMTLASAALAWTQAKRHEDLTAPYALAAQELRELSAVSGDIKDANGFEQLVVDVEESISREHTMWRARRGLALGATARV